MSSIVPYAVPWSRTGLDVGGLPSRAPDREAPTGAAPRLAGPPHQRRRAQQGDGRARGAQRRSRPCGPAAARRPCAARRPPPAARRAPPRWSTAAASPASCSRLPLTTQGYIVYARSPAGDGVRPIRCSRAAAPSATADGSSMRRIPLSSSTSSCSSQPSQPTASSPSTFSSAAYSSALNRSSTWQNCQAGRDPGDDQQPRATRSSGSARCRCRRPGRRAAPR